MGNKMLNLTVIVIIVFSLFGLIACEKSSEDDFCKNLNEKAVLYDRVTPFMSEEFLNENRTNGAWDSYMGQYIQDDSLPRTRIVTIKSLEEFIVIFDDFPSEIDFISKMVVLYGETTSSARDFELGNIDIQSNVLSIEIKDIVKIEDGLPVPGGNIRPYTRWTAVLLDKFEFESIKITY